MRTSVILGLSIFAAALPSLPAQEAWAAHRGIRVLYAGAPGGSREQAFAKFLRAHFDRVQILDLAKLDAAAATDSDVVIADWVSQYGNDGYQKADPIKVPITLDVGFTKPVITMSYVASQLRPGRKLDWL